MEEGPPFDLLRCAHCAAPARMEEHEGRYAVFCTYQYCGICTPLCSTQEWAAKYWNRRDWKPADK